MHTVKEKKNSSQKVVEEKRQEKKNPCHLNYVGDSALFNSGIAETLAMDK